MSDETVFILSLLVCHMQLYNLHCCHMKNFNQTETPVIFFYGAISHLFLNIFNISLTEGDKIHFHL